ncbi:MAG: hypothetical protein WCY16_12380 [Weeksellaceae bacterium]
MQRRTAVRLYKNKYNRTILIKFFQQYFTCADPQCGSYMYSQKKKSIENVLVLFLVRSKPKTVTKQRKAFSTKPTAHFE